jgi:hypothetical protein
MTKGKALMVTCMFALMLGAILYQIATYSHLATCIVLAIFAVPAYILLWVIFFIWITTMPEKKAKSKEVNLKDFDIRL